MNIKRNNDVQIGDTVKYYDYASHTDRAGKVCDCPSSLSYVSTNYVWCNFDDENVPEAIDIIKTSLIKLGSLDNKDGEDDPDPPEINKKIPCTHPKESVRQSFVIVNGKKVDFELCKKCGSDWDI